MVRGGRGFNQTEIDAFINIFMYAQQFYGLKGNSTEFLFLKSNFSSLVLPSFHQFCPMLARFLYWNPILNRPIRFYPSWSCFLQDSAIEMVGIIDPRYLIMTWFFSGDYLDFSLFTSDPPYNDVIFQDATQKLQIVPPNQVRLRVSPRFTALFDDGRNWRCDGLRRGPRLRYHSICISNQGLCRILCIIESLDLHIWARGVGNFTNYRAAISASKKNQFLLLCSNHPHFFDRFDQVWLDCF